MHVCNTSETHYNQNVGILSSLLLLFSDANLTTTTNRNYKLSHVEDTGWNLSFIMFCFFSYSKCVFIGLFIKREKKGIFNSHSLFYISLFFRAVLHFKKIQVYLKKLEHCENVHFLNQSFQKIKLVYYIDTLHIEQNISCLYFLSF